MVTLYFTPTIGEKRARIPADAPSSAVFRDVLRDIVRKLGLSLDAITVSYGTEGLNSSELEKTVGEIYAEYGDSFKLLSRGEVGTKTKGLETGLEEDIPEIPDSISKISPTDGDWMDRVKIELALLVRYSKLLKKRKHRQWFRLVPRTRSNDNYQIWRGYVKVPARPKVKLDLAVVLTTEYPGVMPRAFLDEKVSDLCDKLWPKLTWTEDDKRFVMICHDHMKGLAQAWHQKLGIVHFLSRQVWIWWIAQQELIMRHWT